MYAFAHFLSLAPSVILHLSRSLQPSCSSHWQREKHLSLQVMHAFFSSISSSPFLSSCHSPVQMLWLKYNNTSLYIPVVRQTPDSDLVWTRIYTIIFYCTTDWLLTLRWNDRDNKRFPSVQLRPNRERAWLRWRGRGSGGVAETRISCEGLDRKWPRWNRGVPWWVHISFSLSL